MTATIPAISHDDIYSLLQLCQSYDARNIDGIMRSSWHDAAAIARWDRDGAVEAIKIHFATSTERIMPGHVTAILKSQKSGPAPVAELRAKGDLAAICAPNTSFGGLPINTDGDPIRTAYEINDAIRHHCPRCDSEPMRACYNHVSGKDRRIPCMDRIKRK